MPKIIRVTETRVAEYVPDFAEEFYSKLEEHTLEAAIEADKVDYAKGDVTVNELDPKATLTTVWEIVEVEDGPGEN